MEPRNNIRSRLGLEDYLLLGAVLLLPWAFGGVELWAFRGAAFLVALGAAVALWKRGAGAWGLTGQRPLWLLPAFLLAVWGGLQLVPLPPGALRVVSPEAHRIYADAFPGYPSGEGRGEVASIEAAALERVPEAADHPLPATPPGAEFELTVPDCFERSWLPVSVQPSATQERLLWYLALLVGFLLIRERVADPRLYPVYLAALLVNLTLMAMFGLVQDQTWNGKIYWLRRPSHVSNPFGPYVNPDHFAALMELAVPALAGYAWSRIARVGRAAIHEARVGGAIVAAAICVVAAVVAASKMAALLILVGLISLAVLGVRSMAGRAAVLAAGLVLAVAAGFMLSETGLGGRVEDYLLSAEEGTPIEGRMAAWRGAHGMFRDFTIAGSGFGTFREVFPSYLLTGASHYWVQAHNDYIEVLLDGGVVALGLTLWLALGFWILVLRRVRGTDEESRQGQWGIVLGIGALTIHGLVDFNHQMPGTAILFVAFCALALPGARGASLDRSGRTGRAVAAVLLVAVFGYRAAAGIAAGWTSGDDRPLGVGFDRLIALREAAETSLDDWESDFEEGGPGAADPALLRDAAEAYLSCRCVAPVAMWSWKGLSKVYDRLEWSAREMRTLAPLTAVANPWERVGKPGRVAVGMARRALEIAPNWYVLHDRLALTLWSYGLEDEARDVVRDSARVCPQFGRHRYPRVDGLPGWVLDDFTSASREVLGEVSFLPRSVHLIELGKLELRRGAYEQSIADLTEALGGRMERIHSAEARFHLALALRGAGRDPEAREHLTGAASNPAFREAALTQLVRSYESSDDNETALRYLWALRREDPRDADYCLWFARVARKLGDWPGAREALRWAQVVEPLNPAPVVALIETYIDSGDLISARQELNELLRRGTAPVDAARLQRELQRASLR